ncbi:MAG: hypothetical protein K8R57_07345 [Verrucomicrobia bacterium]|nr:hypothetical protein [Verrucomicrobiota bacterium]
MELLPAAASTMQKHHGAHTDTSPGGTHLLKTFVLFSSGRSELLGEQLILNIMTYQNFKKPSPFHFEIDVEIPEELEYFVTETCRNLQIAPDELVRQAVGSYCREKQGARHE